MSAGAALGALGYAGRAGPLAWLVALSAACFAVILGGAGSGFDLAAICGTLRVEMLAGLLDLSLRVQPLHLWVGAWLLMVTAMMAPLLALPVGHLWAASFPERRGRALALFAAGYAAVWLGAGAMLVPLAALLRVADTGPVPALLALGVALIWSASPLAQRARNRCHRLRRIAPFGWAADRDGLLHGVTSARPCVAACWAWMLLPLTVAEGHLAAMAAVTVLLFAERLAPPAAPSWRWPQALALALAMLRPAPADNR